MEKDEIDKELQILVLSFDGFRDLWPVFFQCFFDMWPDCPFKINLLTNHLSFQHPGVRTIAIGEDLSWSSNLLKGVEAIDAKRVLFFFEDAFLSSKVSTDEVMGYLKFAQETNADYLRLKRTHKPDYKINKDIGLLRPGGLYRLTLFLSIIKKSVLSDLIDPKENAWEFEFKGAIRSDRYKHFYSVYNDCIHYNHAIIKGQWTASVVPYVTALGINVNERGISDIDESSMLIKLKKYILIELLPVKVQRAALKFYQFLKSPKK
jgi:hypothetical protein